MHIEYYIAFLLYLTGLFSVAMCFRKKQSTSADMLIGGRTLNFWVTALSAQASDMSSWLFMAFPMSIFLGGMPNIWIAISLFVGMVCTWQCTATRLRIATERANSYTLSTFLGTHFKDTSGTIRTFTALLCIYFLSYYLAAGLISMGFLLESLFAIDYTIGVILAATVIIAYTFIGGFVSVAWADLFQALFLLVVIIVVPCMAFFTIDGWDAIAQAAAAKNISLTPFSKTGSLLKDIIFVLFGWGLGYFGMPHIVTKFMGIKNAGELKKSKYVGLTWMMLTLSAAAMIGFIGIAYFPTGCANPELVFVEMVKQLFHPFAAALAFCAILAATISTMDSQILVASSMMTEDLYKFWVSKRIRDKREIYVFRLSVIAISCIALVISLGRDKTIMETVYYAWAGLGCSFSPLVLTALYWKRATKEGAIAGIILGGLIAASWPTMNRYLIDADLMGAVPTMIPGFFVSLLAIWIVSQLTQKEVVVVSGE